MAVVRINQESLIAIRELTGWSQAELARQSGVSQGQISALEAGTYPNPRPATVKKLATALGRPMLAIVHADTDPDAA